MVNSKFKWGIIGTGGIAHAFANDIKLLEGHKVTAVGSRTVKNANLFASNFIECKPYGSYLGCINDPNVDGVYIATPHNSHCEYSILALKNGKPVLCEKPFSINLKEAKSMIKVATENDLLIMEAMWTRFLPHIKKVRKIIEQNTLGEIKTLYADHGQNLSENKNPRLWEPDLGGGALLDLGIYVVSFSHLILGTPQEIISNANFTDKGVDEQTSVIFNYKNKSQSVLKMTLKNNTPCKAMISGDKGYLEISGPFYAPASIKLILNDGTETYYKNDYNGQGLREQAYEFARCHNLKLSESPSMSHQDTLAIMKSMDLIRKQIGLEYPNDKQNKKN